MRYLGVDYGAKRTGIALSDPAGSFAFPKEVLATDARLPARVAAIARGAGAEAIVVGDSRAFSGEANTVTAEVDRFADKLGAAAGIPVHRAREAWSSMEASRFAPPGKEHDDSAAAAIILQRFLDQGAGQHPDGGGE